MAYGKKKKKAKISDGNATLSHQRILSVEREREEKKKRNHHSGGELLFFVHLLKINYFS